MLYSDIRSKHRDEKMLILTRRVGEKIMIDSGPDESQISVTVLGVKGNQIRLGIDAPEDVPIARDDMVSGSPRRRGASADGAD